MLSTRVATAMATTIGQSAAECADGVLVDHRADVDTEHSLGGDARVPW